MAIVALKIWRTPQFPYFSAVVWWSISGFVISWILSLILRRLAQARWSPARMDGATSWLIAIELGILLLVVPAFLLAKGTPNDEITGWVWPLVNKRWLLALYNIAIATFVVFPLAIARWRCREPLNRTVSPAEQLSDKRGWLAALGCIAILATCWYLAGPPWHLDRLHRSIEWHEQVHFGALQAIAKGYLAYTGPAATAYGPGALEVTYKLMRSAGSFDLIAFRSAWLAQHFMAVLAVGLVAWWFLGTLPAFAVIVLALAYSPLQFFYTLDNGTMSGFFGWANALRYGAPLLVIPAIAGCGPSKRETPAIVLLGAVWGVGAWLAQDSLTTTATAAILLLAVLVLTETLALRPALAILRNLTIGFACAAAGVLGYYAWHRSAAEFLEVFFAFPHAITAGLGDAWWPPQEARNLDRISYYLTLPFLVACCVCALWRFPDLEPVRPLDARRRRFLAFVCVQLVCYQSVLFWSDSSHLTSTMIALPFVLVLGILDLPQWLANSVRGRLLVRAGFVALALAVYPLLVRVTDPAPILRAARRFQVDGPAPRTQDAVVDRTGPLSANEPLFIGGDEVSVGEFQHFASDLRMLIGDRKTYCLRVDWIAGGLFAFLADLTPAPHPPAGDLLSFNDGVHARVADDIRVHPADYEAFIGPSLTGFEAQAFLQSHPDAVSLERTLGKLTVHILLSHQ
jgi:hypothetical protein